MTASQAGLLAGMDNLKKTDPFPDEIFYSIFEEEDIVERQKYIEALRNKARDLGRALEFKNILKQFQVDYAQKMRRGGNVTHFFEQPLELQCGEWIADDRGVRVVRYDKQTAQPVTIVACSHPILPVEILKNVDTEEERITLAYYKSAVWQRRTVDRSVCANSQKIVDVLSKYGIEVTSDNAKHLVRYISQCVGNNPATLAPKRSINRLGWAGTSFIPYEEGIRYEENSQFTPIYRGVRECGSFETWQRLCAELRRDIRLRLMMGASFASALLEPLHVLPFVCHIWGKSGTCKTVALMVCASIWGNPKMGALVKTMNATNVGITRSAAFLCSIPFIGDELQTIKTKWIKNYDQLIYQVTEGIERVRGKRTGGVEETMTWRNTFLFSGEEPIVKIGSSDGSRNRVIEIAVSSDAPLMGDGHHVSGVVLENYGHAGKRFVQAIQQAESSRVTEKYKEIVDSVMKSDTTDKQAMAMSCVLLADEMASRLFWPGEPALTRADWEPYLQKSADVDMVEQARQDVFNWAATNQIRFEDPKGSSSDNKGEVWGRIEEDRHSGGNNLVINRNILMINRNILMDFLAKEGYDYVATTKGWAERKWLVKNSQGKYVHQTKVCGIRASYIKLILPEQDDDTDKDGFMAVDPEQMSLPFD